MGLPAWAWMLLTRHLSGKHSRPAVRWMNRFAFVGVTIAVFAWVSVVSIMNGLQGEIRDNVLNEKAHLLWEGSPRPGLEAYRTKLEKLLGPELRSSRFLLQTEGLLEVVTIRQKGRILGSGVVLQGVPGMGAGLQVGSELAELLGLGTGDEVKLRSAWKLEGAPYGAKVVSIFESGVQDVDRSAIRMDRGELASWLGLGDSLSRIEIQLRDPMKSEEWAGRVSEVFGVPFKTWRQVNASLWYSLRIEKLLMTVIIAFVVILAALSVHLALAVRVAEKTREIGLLKALGASPKMLSRMYFTEGVAVGSVGAVLGLLLSRIFCLFVGHYIQMPDFYYATNIPVDWNWGTSLVLVFFAIAASALASLGPSLRAARATASDALRS